MNYLQLCGTALLMLITASCASSKHRSTTADFGPVEQGAIGQVRGQDTEVTIHTASVDTLKNTILNIEMDSFDRRQLNYAYERGPAGQPVAWVNPDTGNDYQVVSQFASRDDSGRICRQSELFAHIDGRRETLHLMVCRNSEGAWVLQE